MKLDLSFWTNASTRRKRIYTFLFILVWAILLTVIGALIPISHSTATQIFDQLNQTVSQQKSSGTVPQFIFLNNFRICLIFFIPIVGPLFGVGIGAGVTQPAKSASVASVARIRFIYCLFLLRTDYNRMVH